MASYPTPPPSNPAADMAYAAPKLSAQQSYYHDAGPPTPADAPHNSTYAANPPGAFPQDNSYGPQNSTHAARPSGGRVSPSYPQGNSYGPQNAPYATKPSGGRASPTYAQIHPYEPHRPSSHPSSGSRASSSSPNAFVRPISPYRRKPTPPFMYAPGRTPSPYAVGGRPQPRPGFIARVEAKLTKWIQGFMRWARKNPIKAGLLTFLPFAAAAVVSRLAGVIGKASAPLVGAMMQGLGGKKRGKGGEKGLKEGENAKWGYGMDHFDGFEGSKGGPINGLLKMVHLGA